MSRNKEKALIKEKAPIPSNRLPEFIWAKIDNNTDVILDISLYEPFIEGEFNHARKIKVKELL